MTRARLWLVVLLSSGVTLFMPSKGFSQGGSYYDYYLNGTDIDTEAWAYPEAGEYGCSSDVGSYSILDGTRIDQGQSYPSFTDIFQYEGGSETEVSWEHHDIFTGADPFTQQCGAILGTFDIFSYLHLSFATTFTYRDNGGGNCTQVPACSNTNTPECGASGFNIEGSTSPCYPYYYNGFLVSRLPGHTDYHCSDGVVLSFRAGPGWCTPHP